MSTPALPPGYQEQGVLPAGYQEVKPPINLNDPTQVAPVVGRAAAASLPAIGGILGSLAGGGVDPLTAGAGAGLGSVAAQELRNEFPKLFGNLDRSPAGFATQVGSDVATEGAGPELLGMGGRALVNAISPSGAGAIVRNFPAFRQAASQQMTGQALKKYSYPESNILETSAANAKDSKDTLVQNIVDAFNAHPESIEAEPKFYHPEVKQAIQADADVFGKNTVGKQLVQLQKEYESGEDVAGSQTYKQIANTALSDLTHVRNFTLATGEPKNIEQLAINKLVTNGFKVSDGTLDTKYILNELGGKNSEIYKEAIDPKTLGSFKQAMTEIENQKAGHGVSDAMLRWSNGHLLWTVPMALGGLAEGTGLGHIVSGLGAASTGMVVTNKVLAKLMSDPTTAKLAVAAMRTGTSTPQAGLISQILTNTLRGAEVPAQTKDQ